MKRVAFRIMVAIVAALGIMSAIVAIRFFGFPQILARPFPLVVVTLSLATGLITTAMAVAPNRYWNSWENRLENRLRQLTFTRLPPSHRVAWLAILASWICFVFIVTQLGQVNTDHKSGDQATFLRYARDIKEHDGITGLVAQLFQGTREEPNQHTRDEANQHPLFPALLSFAPTFSPGKLLSLIIGTLTLLLVTLLTARKWNLTVAAIVSLLLSTNFAFCATSTMVTCEGLLTLLISLTWLVLAKPVKEDEKAQSETESKSSSTFLAIGGLLGLSFLTKGTGPLFLVITLAWLTGCHVYQQRGRDRIATPTPSTGRFPWRPLTLILLAWLIVAAPLVTYNLRRFGNPIYNANSYFLFLDNFEDLQKLDKNKDGDKDTSVAVVAQEYFASHSAGQVFQREAEGLCWESYIFIRSLGPAPLDDSRILFGFPCLLLALAGMFAERRQAGLLLIGWILCFLVMFAWYMPIAAGQRFTVPLLPALLVCAATGLARLGHSNGRLAGCGPYTWLGVALLWCFLWTGLTCFLITGATTI